MVEQNRMTDLNLLVLSSPFSLIHLNEMEVSFAISLRLSLLFLVSGCIFVHCPIKRIDELDYTSLLIFNLLTIHHKSRPVYSRIFVKMTYFHHMLG